MPSQDVNVSPTLQRLIDGPLLDRLPVTFAAYCFEQFRSWATLFPAEQGYYERLFGLLDRSDGAEVDRLFQPMRDIEQKMGASERTWKKREFTLDQVDFLNRNALYPQWRAAVSRVFAEIDPLLDREIERKGHARLVVVIAPSELPVGPDRMWTRIQNRGFRLKLELTDKVDDFTRLLLAGTSGTPIINRRGEDAYNTWLIEAGSGMQGLGAPGAVKLSYAELESYRHRLMKEVNGVVQSREIRGPRELSARLSQLKVLPSESALAGDTVLSEFTRSTLLSGNGTLLVNNTFVEWATIQAIRRARPSILVAGFGIRNKVKPFSSLLIYADQDTVSPIPTQMDTLGSYVDLEIFYQYIWQECEKYADYRKNTAYIFAAEGMDELLVIAPPDFPLRSSAKPLTLPSVHRGLRDWVDVT
jgi:hypothetical protein